MNTEDYRQQYFIAARKLYHDAREVEWRILRDKLKKPLNKAGYEVQTGNSGHGLDNYTCGSNLRVPFDLSNWRWIAIQKDKEDALIISLQAPDCDSNEAKKNEPRNHHILEDRIAFIAPGTDGFDFCGKVTAKVTDYTLPLSDAKMDDLASDVLDYLNEHSNNH